MIKWLIRNFLLQNNNLAFWLEIAEDYLPSQLTCSKLTVELLEQGVKYIYKKVNKKDTRPTPLLSQEENITYFTPCSSVSIVNFEHVIVGWEDL